MLQAMETIGLDEDERSHIFSLIFGILHLGNVMFQESNNDVAYVQMEDCKFFKIFYSGLWKTCKQTDFPVIETKKVV